MNVEDWGKLDLRVSNEHGVKARIGQSKSSYSDWRRTIGYGCYANDVDWLEWRQVGDRPIVVAIIETSFYEDKPEWRHKLPIYCLAALTRFKRDGQYQITRLIAQEFSVSAYFVLVRDDLANFFVCDLSRETWREMTEPFYRSWIVGLPERI